jgi:single-strand DNA-binding protein
MPGFDINRVVLIGRLTRDPELRALSTGGNVCSLRIACNARRRDADGQRGERPNFFDVSVFGPPADTVATYLQKGRLVGVDGRLEWREWETAEQQKRQAVSVVADNVEFLDGPGGREAEADGDGELVATGDEVPF